MLKLHCLSRLLKVLMVHFELRYHLGSVLGRCFYKTYSSLLSGGLIGNVLLALASISSLIISLAWARKVSIQLYPTPSLNCSFCLQATSSGRSDSKSFTHYMFFHTSFTTHFSFWIDTHGNIHKFFV